MIRLNYCTRPLRTALKGKGNNFDWLLLLFSVFEINLKMLVNHLEIWDRPRNSGLECTFMDVGSSLTLSSHSFHFALGFSLSFKHFLHTFRKVIFTVLIDDLFKYSFPSFIFFFLNSFQKIHLTVPRQRLSDESIFFFVMFVNGFGSWL